MRRLPRTDPNPKPHRERRHRQAATPQDGAQSPGGNHRGQLLLITAMGMAILFVALALIMNTAIYTENLASRGSATTTQDALTFRAAAKSGLTPVLSDVNENNATTHGAITRNFSQGTEAWSASAGDLHAVKNTAAYVALTEVTNGTRIDQDVSWRTYTNRSGSTTNWTLATNVNQTRRFRMNVTDDVLVASGTGEFQVRVTNGTQTWRMNVTESGSDIVVGIHDGAGMDGTCSVTGNFVWINLTQGTVGGDDCAPLRFAEPIQDGYRIEFRNPTNASGTYRLIVDNASLATNPAPHFNDDSTGVSPYVSPAVYAARLNVIYQSPNVFYNTSVRIAPGEPE